MITDIPSSADFERTGVSLLNLAWSSVLSLYLNLDIAKVYEEDKSAVYDEYGFVVRILFLTRSRPFLALPVHRRTSILILSGFPISFI